MKIITVKSRTLLLLAIALLLLVLLLPSCTVQKRLYRPGFYVESHQAKKTQPKLAVASVETAQPAVEKTSTAEAISATTESASYFSSSAEQPVAAGGSVTAAAPQKHAVSGENVKRMVKPKVAAPKPLRKMIAKQKAWSATKKAEGRRRVLKIIAGVALLVGLVIISIMIGDPLLIPKVLLIGSVVFLAIIGVAALCLLIYILNWLVDFVEGGCGL